MNRTHLKAPAPSPQPGRPVTGPGHRIALVALGAVALSAACEEVVVQPAAVKAILISPQEAETVVGNSIQLSAEAFDSDDQPLSGYSISWSVDDESIATVDGSGRVNGVSSGTTNVRASVGSVEGMASLSVRNAASIDVDRSSLSFAANVGGSTPPAAQVRIENGGQGDLTGLGTSTSYDGASGWLSTSLSGSRAPATLTVTASPGNLSPGRYNATIRVTADDADNSPVSIGVSLEVLQTPVPSRPSGLSASYRDGGIRVEWSDPSAHETEFRIQRRVGDGSFQQLATVGANVTGYDDAAVESDRRYTYRVRACNPSGCSDWSSEAGTVTPPNAPSELKIVLAKEERVKMVWKDNSDLETGFRIERAERDEEFEVIAEVGRDKTDYEDKSVDEDTRYTYRVRACNDSGCSGPSNEATTRTDD